MPRYEGLLPDASRVTISRIQGRCTIEFPDKDIIRMYNVKKVVLNDIALGCAHAGLWPMSNNRCSEVWIRRCTTTK